MCSARSRNKKRTKARVFVSFEKKATMADDENAAALALADLCLPSPPACCRPRLRAPSLSSSTYRNDYRRSPVTLCETEKAQSVVLCSEREGRSGRALTKTTKSTTRRRSFSPPRDGGRGSDRAHCCHCHCRCSSSASVAAEALFLPPPPAPPQRSLSPAKRLSRSFDSKENISSPIWQRKQKQQQLQPLDNSQLRSSRVSGSALSDALAAFREKEKSWLSEKAALRRDADAARRASLLSEALRAKEATARRQAEAELRAAKAAIRRRDDAAAAEERNFAAVAATTAAAQARVRLAERAASLNAAEAAEAREQVVALEQELADERSRRDGAEAERAGAVERAAAAAAAAASRRAAGKFAAVVEREAERASGAERRLQERVRKVCGVDLSSLPEEEEEEEHDEERNNEDYAEEVEQEHNDADEARDREARLPAVFFTV